MNAIDRVMLWLNQWQSNPQIREQDFCFFKDLPGLCSADQSCSDHCDAITNEQACRSDMTEAKCNTQQNELIGGSQQSRCEQAF